MLLKWIRCTVADRPAFDRGQRDWAGLRELPGFLGQRGGWATDGTANILALWSDVASYQRFMAAEHDELAAGQAGTIARTDVRLFQRRLPIGQLPAGNGHIGGALRLAHCMVRANRIEHFIGVQSTVWNPGMNSTEGFVGGVFAQREELEFLVATQWASVADHVRYQAVRFPALRDRAQPTLDLERITGYVVDLDPGWSVDGLPATP
ncbi:MAG: YdbC family protein [Sciscionella sp.]|nr:YdbC family protein [Sciscionella sp.]